VIAATRRSPIHEELEHLSPTWVEVNGMAAAAHFGNPPAEARQAQVLGLCDVSARSRMGVKGAGAASWLEQNGIAVPSSIYGHSTFGKNGLIIRAASINCSTRKHQFPKAFIATTGRTPPCCFPAPMHSQCWPRPAATISVTPTTTWSSPASRWSVA
jgi:hypothetical protein